MVWKRRLFVKFYLNESNGNATDAARRAGYEVPKEEGHRLLKDPEVKAAIAAQADAALSSDEILSHLAEMATFDIGACLDGETGNVDIKKVIALGLTHMIQSVEPTANGVKVKLYSRKDALELLGKFRKLFVERISLEGFDPAKMTEDELRAIVSNGRGGHAVSRN